MASTRDDDLDRWKVLEQQYADEVRRLQGELKLITHEKDQEIYQWKRIHEAEEKKTRDHQIAWQREMEETHDILREEKDMLITEMNRMMQLYQIEREHNKKHSDDMEILRSEKCSLEECVRELENDRVSMEHQIQEERVKMQRKLAMLQEDIRKKEEEHRAEVSENNIFR